MFGRMFVGLLPWWVFAGLGVMITPIMLSLAADQYTLVRAERAALARPAPNPVPLSAFDPATLSPPFLEFAVTGEFAGVTGVLPRQKVDYFYALVEASEGGGAIALHTAAYLSDTLTESLGEVRKDDGEVLVRGFLIEGLYKSDIRKNLDAQGITLTGPLYVATAYFGTREEALAGQVREGLAIMAIAGFFTVALWGAALAKFWRWRLRRSAKGPRKPARKSRKESARTAVLSPEVGPASAPEKGATKAPSVTSRDGYDDGPIKSKKGLFR